MNPSKIAWKERDEPIALAKHWDAKIPRPNGGKWVLQIFRADYGVFLNLYEGDNYKRKEVLEIYSPFSLLWRKYNKEKQIVWELYQIVSKITNPELRKKRTAEIENKKTLEEKARREIARTVWHL